MDTTIIQAVLNGKQMQVVAKELKTEPSKLSIMLQHEMHAVANHIKNLEDTNLSQSLKVRNAFAIRRDKRAWNRAIANASAANNVVLKPKSHVFKATTVDEAFKIALSHDSISKKDAMILVYNTLVNKL